MSVNIESGIGGAITGIFIAVLTAFGLKGKVDRLEEKKVDRSLCMTLHHQLDERIKMILDSQKETREDVRCIRERMDTISNGQK